MKEDICSIPVEEMFAPREGCPICRMRDALERQLVDSVMGEAMMEPDVRAKTNRMGFCSLHYRRMIEANNALGLALILQTHFAELRKTELAGGLSARRGAKAHPRDVLCPPDSCYICDRLRRSMERMLDTIYRLYGAEEDFRALFGAQPLYCLPHFRLLREGAPAVAKAYRGEFLETLRRITGAVMAGLETDVGRFAEMFDYHNAQLGVKRDWGGSKDAVPRAVAFLIGGEEG